MVTCHSLYVVFTTLQRAVFLVNSRQSQFTVAHRNGHPFFRSYGANLPSSLERFLSRSLVYSTHLPVSVYGTGLRGFLGTAAGDVFRPKPRLTYHCVCHLSAMRPMLRISTGILTCYPSTTLFSLTLGPDSPSADEPSGGTLRFSGHWILTNVFATQANILTSTSSTPTFVNASN